MFGVLGDIHGDFGSVRCIMERHHDIPFWLCVGDVADAEGRYESFPTPVHFIKGNNEGFDAIAEGRLPPNLEYLPNGVLRTIGDLRVAGLGGTFAPTWYETPAAELPYPSRRGTTTEAPAARARRAAAERAASGGGAPRAVRDDKRRHFVREEVDACKAFERLDVFMTHEAPRPYVVKAGARGVDAGKTPVNEVLASAKPRLHLFGHHHRLTEQRPQGVPSVGLDLVSKSYLIVDANTLAYTVVTV